MARQRDEEKRVAILLAAARVIAEEGLAAPTAKIAKAASVADGTLFAASGRRLLRRALDDYAEGEMPEEASRTIAPALMPPSCKTSRASLMPASPSRMSSRTSLRSTVRSCWPVTSSPGVSCSLKRQRAACR